MRDDLIGTTVIDTPNFYTYSHLVVSHPKYDLPIELSIVSTDKLSSQLKHLPIGTKLSMTIEGVHQKENRYLASLVRLYNFKAPQQLKMIVKRGGYKNEQYVLIILETMNFVLFDKKEDLDQYLDYYQGNRRYYIEYI